MRRGERRKEINDAVRGEGQLSRVAGRPTRRAPRLPSRPAAGVRPLCALFHVLQGRVRRRAHQPDAGRAWHRGAALRLHRPWVARNRREVPCAQDAPLGDTDHHPDRRRRRRRIELRRAPGKEPPTVLLRVPAGAEVIIGSGPSAWSEPDSGAIRSYALELGSFDRHVFTPAGVDEAGTPAYREVQRLWGQARRDASVRHGRLVLSHSTTGVPRSSSSSNHGTGTGRSREEQTVSGAGPIVFVVDDDASVRAALDSLFRSVGLVVRSFGSAQEFLSEPPADGPACLVVDVRLPGMSGLDLQRQLAERDTAPPIIIITGHGDIPMTVRAMRAGAVEVLPKPFRDQDLLDAVQQALDRSRELRQEQAAMADIQARFDSLTPRERQVMGGVVAGLLNKQIAYDLGISEVTVKIHRGQVMQKMRAASVADLVRMADRRGIRPTTS